MKLQFLLIVSIIGCTNINAQHDIKMVNSSLFNPDKYNDYKGSPYLWKESKEIIVYDNTATDYNSVMGNYNGVEHEFEVYEGNQYIKLPHETYIKLDVVNDDEVSYSLFSNVHPKLKNKYCILHHRSPNFWVYESFNPKVSLVKIETPGKATEINKISKRSQYYVKYGRKLIEFQPKKKKLIKQFGHKKEINKFLKDNKIKIKKVKDVIPLLEYLDENGWLFAEN